MINYFSNNPNKKYSITLGDGTVLKDLRLNGNNFISLAPITESMFENNLTHVVISDSTDEEVHDYMQLVQIAQYPDEEGYHFVLIDISPDELRLMDMQAKIEYLSMMTGYDI